MNAVLLVALLLGAEPADPLPGAPPDPKAEADRLVAEGAALGQRGDWDGAILRFEQADALFPRAIHACNIGLAHARANRPEKALVNLGACQARATEPLPPWVARRTSEARDALSKGAFAPLELLSATPGLHIVVSHYGDASFTPPVTLWLPLGEHHLIASAPGKVTRDEVLTVASKAALRKDITLDDVPVVVPEPVESGPVESGPVESGPVVPDPIEPHPIALTTVIAPDPKPAPDLTPAWVTIGVGGACVVTGTIFYGLALGTQSHAERTDPGPDFDALNDTF